MIFPGSLLVPPGAMKSVSGDPSTSSADMATCRPMGASPATMCRHHIGVLQRDGRIGAVLAGGRARRVIRHDIVRGKLAAVVGPQRPVAEGLASLHLSEYGRPHPSWPGTARPVSRCGRRAARSAGCSPSRWRSILPGVADSWNHFLPCRAKSPAPSMPSFATQTRPYRSRPAVPVLDGTLGRTAIR